MSYLPTTYKYICAHHYSYCLCESNCACVLLLKAYNTKNKKLNKGKMF